MSDYKLLVLDVDGTLIGQGAYPTLRVTEAVQEARRKSWNGCAWTNSTFSLTARP
jgi:hydroxymethylpyrimidine pyrophosphatase-like HAD family hydrolase